MHKCSSPITKARAVKWGGKFSETKISEKNVKGHQIVVALCSQASF